MPEVICCLCGSKDHSDWAKKDNYLLVKCLRCGFIFIPPQYYSGVDISAQYEENQTSTSEYYISCRYYDIKYARKNLKTLEKYIDVGSILDIGCNVGNFMIAARERKWKLVGIEPNLAAAKRAQEERFTVYNEVFNQNFVKKHGDLYDVVHLGDVIEHVFDPMELLRSAHSALRSGGIIMITTCNIESYWARRYQIKPKEHLVYFTQNTIKTALEKMNCDVLFVVTQPRLRNILAMDKSTIRKGIIENSIIEMTRILRAGKIASEVLSLLTYDEEIFALGRKK